MNQMNLVDYQRYVETKHSKKQINKVILNDLTAEQSMIDLIASTADALTQWLHGDYYHSKEARLAQLHERDMEIVVTEILCQTAVLTDPVEFTSIVGQCAGVLKMSDKYEGIVTTAEIMAVMSEHDYFDIDKIDSDEGAVLYLINNIELSEQVMKHIHETKYLPPMVVRPDVVTRNFDNDLLTEKSSMILGKGTHHDEDICLDSINLFNSVPLCLNERILTRLSEKPKNPDMDADTKRQWLTFVTDSYRTYRDLIQVGNEFYERHKVDKRGRTYAQGYHVSTQGNQFRKAIVEFAEKEVIEG
ncbi:hypothetical protein ALT721_800047 [Alteromonas alvinellae]